MQRLAGHLLAASGSGLETRDLIPGQMHSFPPWTLFPPASGEGPSLQMHSPAYCNVQAQDPEEHMEAPAVWAEGLVKEFCSWYFSDF